MVIGNIVKRTTISILVVYPYPNIVAITGAKAGTGISCKRKRNGKKIVYVNLFFESSIPNVDPTISANVNPINASEKLLRDLSNTVLYLSECWVRNSFLKKSKRSVGLGSILLGI